MEDTEELAKIIEELCAETGISKNKMLRESGAGERLYYNLSGGSYPSVEKYCKMADYFDVSVDYLLGRTTVREMATEKPTPVAGDGLYEELAELMELLPKLSRENVAVLLSVARKAAAQEQESPASVPASAEQKA